MADGGGQDTEASYADLRAQLLARQQQARIAEVQEQEEETRGSSATATAPAALAARDAFNDKISKLAVAGTETGFIPLLWFNLQLFKGHLIGKGKDPYISPPSWKPLKIPLPDMTAVAAILFVDLAILTLGLLQICLLMLFVMLIVDATTHPVDFLRNNWAMFSSLIVPMLQWLGLPTS